MWVWVMAQAKSTASPEAIATKRKQWVSEGKDQQVGKRCRTAQRYVVAGTAPTQVFWLLETEDPSVAQVITEHFGELWTIDTHVVVLQPISDAVGRKGA